MQTNRPFIRVLAAVCFAWFADTPLLARELKLRLPFLCTAEDLPWLQITEVASGTVYQTVSPRVHMLDKDGTLCIFRIPDSLRGNYLVNQDTGVGASTGWSWYAKIAIDGTKEVIELSPPNTFGTFKVDIPREFYDMHELRGLDWYATAFRLDEATGLPDPYCNFSTSVFPKAADRSVSLNVPFLVSGKYLLVVESSDLSIRAYQKLVKIEEQDLSTYQPDKSPMQALKALEGKSVVWRLGKEHEFKGRVFVGFRSGEIRPKTYYLDKEGRVKDE